MKKAVKVIISGTVQGVFFRSYIKEQADALGLKGYVRNLENGDVEAVFEGDHDKVLNMISVCSQGPKFAKIKDISVSDVKFSGEFKDFRVIRF